MYQTNKSNKKDVPIKYLLTTICEHLYVYNVFALPSWTVIDVPNLMETRFRFHSLIEIQFIINHKKKNVAQTYI